MKRALIFIGLLLWGYTCPQSLMAQDIKPKSDIIFDSRVIDLGTISEDDPPVKTKFRFTNKSDKAVVIFKVNTTCGCVGATPAKKVIKAGERGEIEVEFKPKDHPGALSRNVYIYTDDSDNPAAKLSIRGVVTPTKDPWNDYRVVLGPSLRSRTNSVTFSKLESGTRTERIECVNSGTEPLKLTILSSLSSAGVTFRTDPQIIEPGAVADLVISIDWAKTDDIWNRPFSVGFEDKSKNYRYILKINIKN